MLLRQGIEQRNDLPNLSARLLLKGTNVQKKNRFEIKMQLALRL